MNTQNEFLKFADDINRYCKRTLVDIEEIGKEIEEIERGWAKFRHARKALSDISAMTKQIQSRVGEDFKEKLAECITGSLQEELRKEIGKVLEKEVKKSLTNQLKKEFKEGIKGELTDVLVVELRKGLRQELRKSLKAELGDK